jgi:hypothetical protein
MADSSHTGQNTTPRRIHIQVPEQYKPVIDDVWDDLELYLYQGFLTTSIFLHEKTFVFKTLNHNELRYIQLLKPLKTSAPDIRVQYRSNFIAHSIFLIDGENTLTGRARYVNRLSKIISKIDHNIQEKIIDGLSALNGRATRLYPLTEIYIHENRSRFKWMHIQQAPIHSPINTGISGTDEIGMNYCQQAWTALNRLVDDRDRMERDWTNAKFIGSCFAGKGVRTVDERDRARKERERTELEDQKIQVLHAYLNRQSSTQEAPNNQVALPDGRMATVSGRFKAESVYELADQLSAALSGEKDHHDLVVEAKVDQLRDRAAQIETTKTNIYRAPIFDSNKNQMSAGAQILGGKEEAEALLERSNRLKMLQLQNFHRQIPGDEETSDDTPGTKKA